MSELISNAKAQELVSYLNKRIKDTGYNERQCAGNTVVFELSPGGQKFFRVVCQGSSHCFVDSQGNIYKCASYKAPAKGIRATVDDVVSGKHPFFAVPGKGFDAVAYSILRKWRK
jgi:hypothetical protein